MTNPRDQFGLHLLFHGQYSQNKNKRWLIPDTIKENISLMQARQTMNWWQTISENAIWVIRDNFPRDK